MMTPFGSLVLARAQVVSAHRRRRTMEPHSRQLAAAGAASAMNVIIAVFAALTSGQFSGWLDETATALPCIACTTDDQP